MFVASVPEADTLVPQQSVVDVSSSTEDTRDSSCYTVSEASEETSEESSSMPSAPMILNPYHYDYLAD